MMQTADILKLLRNSGDAKLKGIVWDELDLLITLLMAMNSYSELVCFRFRRSSNLEINLKFEDLTDMALVWEISIRPHFAGRKNIIIDFAGAPLGFLSFQFDDVTIEP